ncbi:MAG: TPMT family class I SAM-dependent methyltransferase [Bacteroidetes bacterium]|nr:TPMT family class I SAM-dependent methyltransferase [Bacteroidota bacterium]
MDDFLNKNYWDERYLQDQTGWDIGYVSPPLKQFFDTLTNKHLRILIPGGGNSYEAVYLLEQGFKNVTVVDISEVVCQRLANNYGEKGLRVVCADFFEHSDTYDLIVEQTFFCAISPSLRGDYVHKMTELLSEDGVLAGLLFNRAFEGGPPFGGSVAEYQALFDKAGFKVAFDLAPASIPPRAGSEVFFIAKR